MLRHPRPADGAAARVQPDRFAVAALVQPAAQVGESLSLGFGGAQGLSRFLPRGRQFLLPLRAQIRMATADLRTRNDVEFHSYRKFAAETSITFGDPR